MIRMHPAACALAMAASLGLAVMVSSGFSAERSEQTVELAPGGRATVELAENPSTGYVWRFDSQRSKNAVIVRVADQGFAQAPSDRPLVGAPGRHRWSIEGISAGRAELTFVNLRPWEDTPVREHVVAVDVR